MNDYLQICFGCVLKRNGHCPSCSWETNKLPHLLVWPSGRSYCIQVQLHGQDLHEDNLLKDLEWIVEVLICKKCRQASLPWLKTNEALVNTTVGSKAPKSHHHGSSEGSDVWVACVVRQKDLVDHTMSQRWVQFCLHYVKGTCTWKCFFGIVCPCNY